LDALTSLCEPQDPIRHLAQRLLQLEELPSEGDDDDWPLANEPQATSDVVSEDESSSRSLYRDDDGLLHLIPAGNTGLSHWRFNQYDNDFFPSVPHGHGKTDYRTKLDPYLGWVLRNSRQLCREPRKKIVALWNDAEFRQFALRAVDYYITVHPDHVWRVPNPRRLPRKR
jgi:hypothetical protein